MPQLEGSTGGNYNLSYDLNRATGPTEEEKKKQIDLAAQYSTKLGNYGAPAGYQAPVNIPGVGTITNNTLIRNDLPTGTAGVVGGNRYVGQGTITQGITDLNTPLTSTNTMYENASSAGGQTTAQRQASNYGVGQITDQKYQDAFKTALPGLYYSNAEIQAQKEAAAKAQADRYLAGQKGIAAAEAMTGTNVVGGDKYVGATPAPGSSLGGTYTPLSGDPLGLDAVIGDNTTQVLSDAANSSLGVDATNASIITNGDITQVDLSGDLLSGNFVSSLIDPNTLQGGNLSATDSEIKAGMDAFLKSIGMEGGLDLSGYDAQKQNLRDYIAQMGAEYSQAYDRIMEQIQQTKQDLERGFRSSSQSLSEQAYMRGRQREAALAERGLGGSGLAQAGAIQERMTEGQARNELYQQYTGTQKEILNQGTQASENLANQLAQLKIQQNSGELSIDQAKRDEQKVWGQYLGSVYNDVKSTIEDGKWKEYQVAQDAYDKALAAEQMSYDRNLEQANTAIQALIDDYQYAMNNADSLGLDANALRGQYEAARNDIINKYGLAG